MPCDVVDANNDTVARVLKDYYLNFVVNLDPNGLEVGTGQAKPYWPQYSPVGSQNFTILDFNYTMIDASPDRDASARCDFLHAVNYVTRN